jgi:3-hydroxyacyl-CoA dehydrogenase
MTRRGKYRFPRPRKARYTLGAPARLLRVGGGRPNHCKESTTMQSVDKGLPIRRAAVLGAGVMGRGIAAHLAGAGIEVLLLDIVPPGGAEGAARNAFAENGLKAAINNKPALFFDKDDASLIKTGNFEDDLARVAEVDWIVEVVKEDLAVKKALFEKLDVLRKPGTLISSNTSGIPLAALIEGRSEDFKRHFIITHFFNPVRYLKLLEVVSGPETAPGLRQQFEAFARTQLGKGVVIAKDSPAFVANRIGTFGLMFTVHEMLRRGHSPEAVDAIFGEPMGRPKSAVFRTADVVGLDTLLMVADNLHAALKNDPMRDAFIVPGFLRTLVERNQLGDKTKGGCYKKTPDGLTTFDPVTLEYRPQVKAKFDSIRAVKEVEKVKRIVWAQDDAGKFAWICTAQTLIYAAHRLGEVADDLVQIDNAMKWGFGHSIGPFETWDAIGVPESVARMKDEGLPVPAWVEEMLASGRTRFYEGPTGGRVFWDGLQKKAAPEVLSPRFRALPASISAPGLVAKNPGARLWDIGDGVACVEFRTKMNAVDDDVIQMLFQAVSTAEKDFDALILANHGTTAFSAGANLLLVMMAAQQKAWDQLGDMVGKFQGATLALRHSRIPTVAAPFQLTLGGGAEICLGANAIQAHAELYMGLVEVGVGLIPGGGGTFGLLHNVMTNMPADADPVQYTKDAFLTIGMAKVGTSAEESRKLGFLKPTDRVTMDRDELIEAAKQHALGLARSDFKAPKPRSVRAAGRTGYATLYSALWGMQQSHQISEYDLHIGAKLAHIMCGGDVPNGTVVSEKRFHELEREVFLSLCGEQRTVDRIQYMLMNNKPLRN